MALSPEDLAQLGDFIKNEVKTVAEGLLGDAAKAAEQTAMNSREATVGMPDVPADAGPEYYVHLANGDVVRSHDSSSTHLDVGGQSIQVIGRFQIGN